MNTSRMAQVWIIILLVWNLACLSVVLFYLVKIKSDRIDTAAISSLCASAARDACTLTTP